MTYRRRVITILAFALALTASVRADMMPAFHVDATPQHSVYACSEVNLQPANACGSLVDPIILDLDLRSPVFLPSVSTNGERTSQTQEPVRLLAHERGSLDLCLYALMGLGLCRSAPWVKKLHFGGIPDWYHHGGPSQIGHSHPVGPNCLCSAAVCFVQPDCRAEDFIPRHRLGTIVSLWRNSQFTPSTLASRARPARSS